MAASAVVALVASAVVASVASAVVDCRLLETVLLTVNGGVIGGLRVRDVELRAQRVEDGGIGLPVLGVPLLRVVGPLERLVGGVVSRLSVWRVGNFRLRV